MAIAVHVFAQKPAPARGLQHRAHDRFVVGLGHRVWGRIRHGGSRSARRSRKRDNANESPPESSGTSLPMNPTSANARSTAKGGAGRVATAAAYGTLCIVIGVQMPFFPLFLTTRGLGPEAVGLAIAMPMAIRLFAMPVAGILSDKSGMPRAMLAILGVASAAAFALVGLVEGTAAILLAVGLTAVVW